MTDKRDRSVGGFRGSHRDSARAKDGRRQGRTTPRSGSRGTPRAASRTSREERLAAQERRHASRRLAHENIEAQREAERVIVARDRDASEIAKAQQSKSTKVKKKAEGTEPGDSRQRLPRARSVERQEHFRERAQAVPVRIARSFKQLPQKVNPVVLSVAALLVVFLAVSIASPLRNYFSQRAELAELNAQIDYKTQQRDELTDELNRYSNEDYIREQARTRLGLIEPGESVYRIFSPKIQANPAGSTPGVDEEQSDQRGEWYEQLWDAIATPPAEEESTGNHVIDNQLPTVPEEKSGHNQ